MTRGLRTFEGRTVGQICGQEVVEMFAEVIWGQFHQRSTSSFYTCRSQKRKKADILVARLGTAHVKAARRTLMKLTPVRLTNGKV